MRGTTLSSRAGAWRSSGNEFSCILVQAMPALSTLGTAASSARTGAIHRCSCTRTTRTALDRRRHAPVPGRQGPPSCPTRQPRSGKGSCREASTEAVVDRLPIAERHRVDDQDRGSCRSRAPPRARGVMSPRRDDRHTAPGLPKFRGIIVSNDDENSGPPEAPPDRSRYRGRIGGAFDGVHPRAGHHRR
jgi:hypothetical protein